MSVERVGVITIIMIMKNETRRKNIFLGEKTSWDKIFSLKNWSKIRMEERRKTIRCRHRSKIFSHTL
tara:strand:+ start:713 stop:913 length:201 start_codon:yes stop_codon:yes gene_type:complete